MNIQAVVFDFDGVIHDTFELAYEIFRKMSPESSRDDFRYYFEGNNLERIGGEFTQSQRDEYRKLEAQQFESLVVESDIKAQIMFLASQFDLYIVSSNTHKNIESYLKRNGLLNNFKEILACEVGHSKTDKFNVLFQRHNLDVDSCIFVTDTLGDIKEANEISLKTIACTFGYHSRAKLTEGNPFALASSFKELIELLAKMV